MNRMFHSFVIVAFSVYLASTAPVAGQLIPRTPLPKPETITKPTFESRLTVKFVDGLKVRAVNGDVVSQVGGDLGTVRAVKAQFALTFQGTDTDCSATKACCVGDGSCVDTPLACCTNIGGTVLRGPDPCDAPTAACCLSPPDGCCFNTTQARCTQARGAYYSWADCETFDCPVQRGPTQWP